MAFIEIDNTNAPAKGKTAGAPTVSVKENGQIGLSTLTSKIVEGCSHVYVRLDAAARIVQLQGVSTIPNGKEKSCCKLAWPKKGNGCSFSFGYHLGQHFKDYDFKASGNQTLSPEVVKLNAEKKLVQFLMPKGKLERKPVVPRKPRAKKVAEAPAVSAVAANTVDADLDV